MGITSLTWGSRAKNLWITQNEKFWEDVKDPQVRPIPHPPLCLAGV